MSSQAPQSIPELIEFLRAKGVTVVPMRNFSPALPSLPAIPEAQEVSESFAPEEVYETAQLTEGPPISGLEFLSRVIAIGRAHRLGQEAPVDQEAEWPDVIGASHEAPTPPSSAVEFLNYLRDTIRERISQLPVITTAEFEYEDEPEQVTGPAPRVLTTKEIDESRFASRRCDNIFGLASGNAALPIPLSKAHVNAETIFGLGDKLVDEMPVDAGRKFDSGKPDYSLVPADVLEEVVKVLTWGATKYERDNWKKVPFALPRYFAAAQRHIWAIQQGEQRDPESGFHHLAHAICCLMFFMALDKD